jgi:hypothetical protein
VGSVTTTYADFLDAKTQLDGATGADPVWVPDFLFPFQRTLTEWAVRQGRAAIFADCGTGKTPMQLVWAENVHRITGRPVLVLTPLAVSYQTVAEAAKFGIEAAISRDGRVAGGITVTNYDRLHHFDRHDFAGVVCDESSAIKSFEGVRRAEITDFMRKPCAVNRAGFLNRLILDVSRYHPAFAGWQDRVEVEANRERVEEWLLTKGIDVHGPRPA